MKRSIGIWVLFLAFSLSAQPADPVEVGSRVLDCGGHHTSWETVWQTTDSASGTVYLRSQRDIRMVRITRP
jgi:hypothetical protein